jgi:hypothetical protein
MATPRTWVTPRWSRINVAIWLLTSPPPVADVPARERAGSPVAATTCR